MPRLVNKRAVIIHPADDDGRLLLRHLRRTGFTAELIWPLPAQLPAGTEIAIVLMDRDHVAEAPRLLEGFDGVSIAIIDSESPIIVEALTGSNVHGVLTKPLRHTGILAKLTVAASLHGYAARLQSRIAHLEGNLRARRIIERATHALMTNKGIASDEAYEFLRREAMARRMTVSGLASALLAGDTIEMEPKGLYPMKREAAGTDS